jgi:hypothetical protein
MYLAGAIDGDKSTLPGSGPTRFLNEPVLRIH